MTTSAQKQSTESFTPDSTGDEAVRWFGDLHKDDIAFAGGKGANLGELGSFGMPVPPGFVVGAPAFREFCQQGRLLDKLHRRLDDVDLDDPAGAEAISAAIRREIEATPIPRSIDAAARKQYRRLCGARTDRGVAVRSSATVEDNASASFAGMNESYLNVRGADAVVDAMRRCWASLFGARTIFYAARHDLDLGAAEVAVIIQLQIDAVSAGVMFTVDPAGGDRSRLVIEAAPGLGEAVVSGAVTPDRYVVDKRTLHCVSREVHRKETVIRTEPGGGTRRTSESRPPRRPVLDDRHIHRLAEIGVKIEEHYAAPQDTEWAIDADDEIWMLQSRPVTAIGTSAAVEKPTAALPGRSHEILVRGLGAAPGAAIGQVRLVDSPQAATELRDGEVLVAPMTAPDWAPAMRRAAAIVTDSGGMTCHAAIVARELGIPCVVGTGTATKDLTTGRMVEVDADVGAVGSAVGKTPARAAGRRPPKAAAGVAAAPATVTGTRILVNLSDPDRAGDAAALDCDGVGLLRAELMLVEALDGEHPRRLLERGEGEHFVSKMAESIERIAARFAPRPVTYRTIDFRSNEFRGLKGGERFEPAEANPMIGYRGALRYAREPGLFDLELAAVRRVWEGGHTNVHVMLPFVRTPGEVEACRARIDAAGLTARRGFEIWLMAEVPSVLFHLPRYAELGVAGISIGSNDLTQLLLGADRDSELVASVFDERDPAVLQYIERLIEDARALGLHTSICGQAPSIHPEYAERLVRAGIDAISVEPNLAARTRHLVAAAEQRLILAAARRLPQQPIAPRPSGGPERRTP
jgi:pyruvate,water dikinase